jgi:hypothetical protein
MPFSTISQNSGVAPAAKAASFLAHSTLSKRSGTGLSERTIQSWKFLGRRGILFIPFSLKFDLHCTRVFTY